MKKYIAIMLTVLALSTLSITAFAADTTQAGETGTSASEEEKSTISFDLTEKEALAAALKDAGEKEADVTVTKNSLSEKETQDGGKIAVYTVKFNTNTTSYKYILDANTGAVLRKEYVYNSPDVSFKNRSHAGGRGEAEAEARQKGVMEKAVTETAVERQTPVHGRNAGEQLSEPARSDRLPEGRC